MDTNTWDCLGKHRIVIAQSSLSGSRTLKQRRGRGAATESKAVCPSSGPKAPRRREPTEIRSTGTVTAPAPSDRRMSLPSPRLSRCCTTPRAVQLGRGAVCCCIVPKALRVAGAYEDQSTGTGGPSFALWRAYFPTVSQAVPKRRHAQSRPAGLWGFRAVFTPSRKFSALRVQVAHSQ